jgi:hypothetical protein
MNVDITPLVATLARWGHSVHGHRDDSPQIWVFVD